MAGPKLPVAIFISNMNYKKLLVIEPKQKKMCSGLGRGTKRDLVWIHGSQVSSTEIPCGNGLPYAGECGSKVPGESTQTPLPIFCNMGDP